MKNSLVFATIASLCFSSASYAQKADESDVQKAMIQYICDCTLKAYEAMSEDARNFLVNFNMYPEKRHLESIETHKNLDQWSERASHLMTFAGEVKQNYSETKLTAHLNKQFPKSEKTIEKAKRSPIEERDQFFWFNSITSPLAKCEYAQHLNAFMAFYEKHSDLFLDLDLDLNLDDLDLDLLKD